MHNILQFSQGPWLKSYIDKNTEERAKAGPKCEKDFFKLMNNSFYGKTIENIRKYQYIVLINNDEKRVVKYQSKPNFVDTVSFTNFKL